MVILREAELVLTSDARRFALVVLGLAVGKIPCPAAAYSPIALVEGAWSQ
jgi:hypothetical protein